MSLVEHAQRELEIIGETDEEFKQMILNCITEFAKYGHSGGSASVAIPMLNDLLRFKNLTPLTNDPAEWVEVGTGTWQSARNPEAFSTDAGASYYLLSEMTPYYASEEHVQEDLKPNVYEEVPETKAQNPEPEDNVEVNFADEPKGT